MSTSFHVGMAARGGGGGSAAPPLSPLQGTLVALQRRGISLPADLDRLLTSSSNNNNQKRGSDDIGRPPVSGVSLLLAVFCFGSGAILLFIAQLFSGSLPAFVIPALHHGWSQDMKSRSCRRAALAYFMLGALILFWGVVVGWCRWRLCVLFGLRVDKVGKKMLGHRRYYQLRGRTVPSSSSATPSNNFYDSEDEGDDCEERGLLMGGGSNAVDIEMSRTSGGDHDVVRRRGQPSPSVADSNLFGGTSTTGTSYRGVRDTTRASPTSPNTTGSRRTKNNNDVGVVKRILGKILLPSAASSSTSDSVNGRSRGGKGGTAGMASLGAGGDGGIHVNQAIRDTLDPMWMSDSFLKHLVKSR